MKSLKQFIVLKIFSTFIVMYALLLGFNLIDYRIYPFSDWNLFSKNETIVTDYDLIDQNNQSIFIKKNIIANNDPILLYDNIQKYAMSSTPKETKESLIAIGHFLNNPSDLNQYDLVKRQYNPIALYQKKKMMTFEKIKRFNIHEH